MANEITISAALSVNKTGMSLSGLGSLSITQSETGNSSTIQNIGTSTEQLVFTDIDNIGYVFLKNLDDTNYIEIGLITAVSSANAFLTLLPGEFALVPTRQETIYAKANTAACNLLIVAAEL